MSGIKIQWLGHSCMKISANDYEIVLDPYQNGSVPGLRNLQVSADEVFCSHEHHDHNAQELVKRKEEKQTSPFVIQMLESFHDDKQGALRGKNNITILTYGDIRVAHMGDMGCKPSEEQMEQLKNLDAIMMPVGGFYTMEPEDCKALLKELSPKVIIPMHYRSEQFGYDQIASLDRFITSEDKVTYSKKDNVWIDKNSKEEILVLSYCY